MKSRVRLDKRYKEILFAAAGFGPNLLMVLMMAYFTDALIPTGLSANIEFWSYCGVPIVSTIIFPILWTIGRCFDGIIDVPLAALTDTLKNKTGKRMISILISFVPMVASFVLCWIPVFGMGKGLSTGQLVGNTIWIFFMSIIFFASYTLALITFYGSLSEVCENQTQRARVSAYKSVFDTISYALVYAAIPAIFKAINVPIWQVALYASPLMLTILIPVFLMKKGNEKVEVTPEANVPIGTSIALTFKSKPFMKWTLVNCVSFFGLQMFLVAQNTLISGVMNLGAGYAAILNTCAFAPVPLMLFLFNKLRKSKGIRFSYQTALIAFGIAIFSFALGGQYIWGDQLAPKLIIGAIGGIIGSWGIGAFFMVPYLIPTVIASVEEEVTHKNHSAMYFAVQALATSVVGAIASSLIYNYLKLWTTPTSGGSVTEWKCGVSLVPFIVFIACFIGFILCFRLPKFYSAKVIYNDIKNSYLKEKKHLLKKKDVIEKQLEKEINEINLTSIPSEQKEALINDKKQKANIKLAKISMSLNKVEEVLAYKFDESTSSANEEKATLITKESLVGNIFLFILTGGIFGIVNYIISYNNLSKLNIKLNKVQKVLYFIGLFIPFISIYTNIIVSKKINEYLMANNINKHSLTIMDGLTSIVLPMFLNLANMIDLDICYNAIADNIANR